MLQARSPLGWYDSLALVRGGEGAAGGFDATLAHARLLRRPPAVNSGGGAHAVGDLVLGNGSGGLDENALWIRRADSLFFVETGAEGWNRDALGPYGAAGRHQYGGAGGWERGRARLEGAFTQRGSAGALAGGEEQSVHGASGHAGLGYRWGRHDLRLRFGRSYDAHESFGGLLATSRRDAREHWAMVDWQRDSVWSARLEARDARVARTEAATAARDWTSSAVWLVVGAEARRHAATLQARVGAGKDAGVGGTELAPSLTMTFHQAPLAARLFVERVLTSVWSDLAAGETAFLQSTWASGFDIGFADSTRGAARLGWLMGRTHDRALIARLPLEDLWLRAGARRDPDTYDFGLATVAAELRGRSWGAGGEAFLLIRDRSQLQPNVDPGRGARGFVEGRWRAFKDDLGVRARGEMEVMGGRESEASVVRVLPRAVSFGASVSLTLADAVVTVRMRNLTDQRSPQTWVDSSTGVEALGPGRELRVSIGWRFFN